MRRITLFAILIFISSNAIAQVNHVQNPSFEQHSNCPTAAAQITGYCTGWIEYTKGSPDYFHKCGTFTVPSNPFGWQVPYSGDAYVGFGENRSSQYREYISATITPLVPGNTYEVSMYVSLSNNSRYANDGTGIYFFKSGPTFINNTSQVLNVTPQVDYASYGPVTDTQNWVLLKKTFFADSAYDHIVIGGFKDTAKEKVVVFVNGGYSYYYVDSVVIQLEDSFAVVYNDTALCAGDTIQVSYITMQKYKSNNVFSVQLSNNSGNFANATVIGTLSSDTSGTVTCVIPKSVSNGTGYRLRVLASSNADTTFSNGFDIAIGNIDSSSVSTSVNSPLCEGQNITFSASTSVSTTTYAWSGPNSFNSTQSTPLIANASAVHSGNYYVDIRFYGCSVKDTLPVAIKQVPAKPTVSNNSPFCEGATLNLTATSSTTGVTYSWSGPNSYTSSTQNPVIANAPASVSGIYTAVVTKNGCSNSDTTNVTIKPNPKAVTLSSNSPLCAGDTLYLQSTASDAGVTYNWTGPNSYTINTQNGTRPNVVTGMTGWYKMTVALNGCTYTDSLQVNVFSIPPSPTSAYNSPLCVGEVLKLTASNAGTVTYSWSGPNNFSSSLQNPTRNNATISDTGMYYVTASANGCTSAASGVSVSINPQPFVVIFPTPGDSLCSGDNVMFTALPNNAGGTPQYRWLVNAQIAGSGITFNTTSLNDGDIVRCDMTEYTKCSVPVTDPSNDVKMNVLPWLAPMVTISADKTGPVQANEYITFTATAKDAGKSPDYQWKRNGKNVLGATGVTWSANTLNDNDTICVEVISNYKCPQPTTAMSNCIGVHILTSVNDISSVKDLVLYPNPNRGSFTLTGTTNSNEPVRLEVINSIGQVVYRGVVLPINRQINKVINIDGVSKGVYLIIVGVNRDTQRLRFTVE